MAFDSSTFRNQQYTNQLLDLIHDELMEIKELLRSTLPQPKVEGELPPKDAV